jgi:halocyanin-like protein
MVEEQRTLTGYPQVDNWLENNDFDGRLEDGRNQSQVTIKVGADGNGGNFAYDPNAILVSQGTELVFEWSGRGGGHDVTWDQGDFPDSESTSSAAKSYSVTMDESGVFLYFCDEDQPGGGRGAVVVQ